MAEQVQAVLDQMVAPLRDLSDRGIFSESEIRAIVTRRRESEYLLRRRAARKADFLRYIEAEMALEKLRAIRTRQVLTRQRNKDRKKKDQEKDSGKAKKTPIGDVHIVQHIHFLFVRALRKFKSDVSLHLQHAAFAKEAKSYSRLGRIYAEALQVHPRNVGLWIEAASLEFFGISTEGEDGTMNTFGGGSVPSARVLLQRGLRINALSKDLWLQYFAMEFHYIQKLRGRREILQLGHDVVVEGKEEGNTTYADAMIPMVVYNNAIKAIPDDVTFRLQFLDLCRGFPETTKMEQHIVSTVARDFQDKTEAWIARAAYAASGTSQETLDTGFISSNDGDEPHKKKRQRKLHDSPVLPVLEEAVEAVPTSEMVLRSIQFLRAFELEPPSGEERVQKPVTMEVKEFIEKIIDTSHKLELSSPELVLELSDYFLEEGRPTEALKALQDYAQSHKEVHLEVWLQWAQLSNTSNATPSASRIIRMALNRTDMQDKAYLALLLELFGALLSPSCGEQGTEEDLSDIFQRILLLCGGREGETLDASAFGIRSVAFACFAYAKYAEESGGLKAARRAYDAVLNSNYLQSEGAKEASGLEVLHSFFDYCIHLEKSKAKKNKSKSKDCKRRLGRLYESAISLFRGTLPALADGYEARRDSDVRYSY